MAYGDELALGGAPHAAYSMPSRAPRAIAATQIVGCLDCQFVGSVTPLGSHIIKHAVCMPQQLQSFFPPPVCLAALKLAVPRGEILTLLLPLLLAPSRS